MQRIFLILFVIILVSCEQDYYPKPKGFVRIDLPEALYQSFDTSYPYRFEYSLYSKVQPFKDNVNEKYWINIIYPDYQAAIHFSYKEVDGNLDAYLNDAHTLVSKLIPKADNIENRTYIDKEKRIFGLVYDIKGVSAASPCQFYVTDSISHFLRGSLYFNVRPNNDSLAPVINFIKHDIDHLIETLEWNN